ncbi:MAG: CRISPR-associated helicase Cas3' [Selenomonadaceae bacterium]
MKMFPAHINENKVQSVEEHCLNVAAYAKNNASSINLVNVGYFTGLFHDIGKFTDAFSEYIQRASKGESVRRGSVNHTFAGVRYLIEHYSPKEKDSYALLTIELIAYAIGAHHGLFDVIDENGNDGVDYRITKEGINYEEVERNSEEHLINIRKERLNRMLEYSIHEVKDILGKITELVRNSATSKNDILSECSFYIGLLERMLLSALIDADRKDTAEFMGSAEDSFYENKFSWKENVIFYEDKIAKVFSSGNSAINKARTEISKLCRDASVKPTGIYRLNIPTGGGKTLSSLRYALHHAERFKKKRIIFVMPLLSIIEQNAEVIKSYVKDINIVLEHHSNVIVNDELLSVEKYKLLSQSWESPIIITTLVQFLNTLFSGNSHCIRRMHSLSESIIVFDEVQTVPRKMLSLFNLACNFLSKICGATIILCSATQPRFEVLKHPLIEAVSALIEIPKNLLIPFDRVILKNMGSMDIIQLAGFAESIIANQDSLLIVCNTKNEAQELLKIFLSNDFNHLSVFHLSASMCKSHRADILNELKKTLSSAKTGNKVICISTQVIEAGVDISFECVIRLQAGMDSIIQAVGRCNRHGEVKGVASAYIVDLNDEKLLDLKDIQEAKNATYAVLNNESAFNGLMSDSAIDFYYKKLFSNAKENYHDFVLKDKNISIYELLSMNMLYKQNCKSNKKRFLEQAFKEAGKEFKVFDENTYDVIVPYNRGAGIISEIVSEKARFNFEYIKALLREAEAYIVSVYNYQLEKLKKNNGVTLIEPVGVYILNPEFYDYKLGLIIEAAAQKAVFF